MPREIGAENVLRLTCCRPSRRRPSKFRRDFAAGHAEFAQLLNERRTPQTQQARGMRDDAVGACERFFDELPLDGKHMCAQVKTGSGQFSRNLGVGRRRLRRDCLRERGGFDRARLRGQMCIRDRASSAATLCARPVRSWMPCCRNLCMRGHSAMAASTRGSVPRLSLIHI